MQQTTNPQQNAMQNQYYQSASSIANPLQPHIAYSVSPSASPQHPQAPQMQQIQQIQQIQEIQRRQQIQAQQQQQHNNNNNNSNIMLKNGGNPYHALNTKTPIIWDRYKD